MVHVPWFKFHGPSSCYMVHVTWFKFMLHGSCYMVQDYATRVRKTISNGTILSQLVICLSHHTTWLFSRLFRYNLWHFCYPIWYIIIQYDDSVITVYIVGKRFLCFYFTYFSGHCYMIASRFHVVIRHTLLFTFATCFVTLRHEYLAYDSVIFVTLLIPRDYSTYFSLQFGTWYNMVHSFRYANPS